MAERRSVPKLLGRVLREQRELVGLTQAEVARRAGVTGGYLWRLEMSERHPSQDVCVRLATVLGLDPVDIQRLAGYLRDEELEQYVPGGAVRKAIVGDPRLTAEHKRGLLALYRSFVGDGDGPDEGSSESSS